MGIVFNQDYFDVIDTPMDFGTICSNLELGVKYRNSEDVFKDVQYIWDNCYKYNNKGDYILDLMRRVKMNFAKYWTSAGLYSGHQLIHVNFLALTNLYLVVLFGSWCEVVSDYYLTFIAEKY